MPEQPSSTESGQSRHDLPGRLRDLTKLPNLSGMFFGIIGVVGTAVSIWQLHSMDATISGGWLVLLIIGLVAIFTGALSVFWFQINTNVRGLADVVEDLTERFRSGELRNHALTDMVKTVSDFQRNFSDVAVLSRESLALTMGDLCNRLASAFSQQTETQCHVCVKEVVSSTSGVDGAVLTVARSGGRRRDDDEHHVISKNTDFLELWMHGGPYWFCSDTRTYPNYMNSSSYATSYRSVIVWPIFVNKDGHHVLRAYLCLDSPQADSFNEESDVSVGQLASLAVAKGYEMIVI